MAVGARGRDILPQFLIEAVTLSIIDGLIGIALGVGGSIAITFSVGWPMIIEIESVFLAFGFSAAVGIFLAFIRRERRRIWTQLRLYATNRLSGVLPGLRSVLNNDKFSANLLN